MLQCCRCALGRVDERQWLCRCRKLWDSMQKVFEQNDKFTSGGVLTMNPIIEGMVALGW